MANNLEKRFWEIDFLRGLAIIMMILFQVCCLWGASSYWNLDYSGISIFKTPFLESVDRYCFHISWDIFEELYFWFSMVNVVRTNARALLYR
ncbi:MAG: DUF1624 domain-containing protein [Methanophagales archaeon]|nr:DUF1624 domain-containing protein [Methanophagales archaeon]